MRRRTAERAAMRQVSFRQMKDGTQAEYLFLSELEREYIARLPDRILLALRGLDEGLGGYRVTRLEHSLQTATRAQADGADDEMIAAALIHDLGDALAPENHSNYAAEILRPYVRAEVTWVVEHHGLFQKVYYAHFFGEDPELRAAYRDHPYYESCIRFCERWDQASFDPDYPTRPLEHFEPLLRRIFSRRAFDPAILDPGK
jgi:predicted HD phosphohydrolase